MLSTPFRRAVKIPPFLSLLIRPLSSLPSQPGLFSLPSLTHPSAFPALSHSAISRCQSLQSDIATPTTTPEPHSITLQKLDAISNIICGVIDAAELTRSVHHDPEWRNAAEESFSIISQYISTLNTDPRLYNAVCALQTAGWSDFNAEERRMVVALRVEFERDGIHMDEKGRGDVMGRKGRITELETAFQQNIVNQRKFYGFGRPSDDEGFGGRFARMFPQEVMDHVRASAPREVASVAGQDGYVLTTDTYFTSSLLKHSRSASVRETVYRESNTVCPNNIDVLQSLIHERDGLAKVLGHNSYGEKMVVDKMAGTTDTVTNFLQSVKKRHMAKYNEEMGALQRIKEKDTGSYAPLEPWDTQYYMNLYRQQMPMAHLGADLSEYLTVDNVLNGLKAVVEKLFDIDMREEEFKESEAWTTVDGGIKKFVFYDCTSGDEIGTLYFDLFPRDNKYTHAAHFTVRCGCSFYDDLASTVTTQTPIVTVVVNLGVDPSNSGSIYFAECETLAHEFGHALHSLLSRTRFQHLSGTRGPTDFVEIPSHLFEYLIAEKETLSLFASHRVTGEPVSDDLVDMMKLNKGEFTGIDTITQAMYADFDQRLFGRHVDARSVDSAAILGRVHENYCMPYATGTHWHSAFGHVNTYGSVYYSYLWAQSIAKDIFTSLEKEGEGRGGIINKESGRRIGGLLSPGSSKEPFETVKIALGGKDWTGHRVGEK